MSTQGGKPIGIRVVTQAELDSGVFRLSPGPAVRVTGMAPETRGVTSGPLAPVFVVDASYNRGIEGGEAAIPVSNLTATTRPVERNLAIPVFVVADDGQFAAPVAPPDLTAPSDLSAVAISDTEIDLAWTDTAPDADGYKIERSPAGTGTWAQIDDIAAPATAYSDTGLTPSTSYDYRIRAYAGATNGDYSNVATETTEATPGGQSALYQSLVAYWALDEASGNRADGIGANTLTDNNTVGSATGLVYATAADFIPANSEYLSIADNADLSMGDIDFWLAAWVRPDDRDGVFGIYSKSDANPSGTDMALYIQDAGKFTLIMGGTDWTIVSVSGASAPVEGVWQLLIGWHDAAANLLWLQRNGETAVSAATAGRFPGANATAASAGRHVTSYFDGLIGPMMIGKGYVPDADDRSWMYNAGAGRTLAEMLAYGG